MDPPKAQALAPAKVTELIDLERQRHARSSKS